MDATAESVIRLYEQGLSIREISRRKICSEQKARKILITAGLYTNAKIKQVSNLRAEGKTASEIADIIGISVNAVSSMVPYTKGMYKAEYPSLNAMRLRALRKKHSRDQEHSAGQ